MATTTKLVERRKRRRWLEWFFVFVIVLDFFATSVFFYVLHNEAKESNRTQVSLRATQVEQIRSQNASCKADNERAIAVRDKERAFQRQQQEGLANLNKIPVLNTDEIRTLAVKNLKDTIAIYDKELKAFKVLDCDALFPLSK